MPTVSGRWGQCALGLVLLAAAGCQKKAYLSAEIAPALAPAPLAMVAGFAGAAEVRRAGDSLAYEHTITIELNKDLLTARIEEVQNACRADKQFGCTLLDVSVSSDEQIPSGSLRMRIAPGGVDTIVATASNGGKVASRTTHAEDLAEPVADTERQLTLLTTHRGRLEDFMKNKALTVDQLITVSKELATVQTQIEQFSTTRANLRRRIDTDLLNISMTLPRLDYRAEQSPVLDALRSFGSDLKQALANVISFFAVLVPWLIVIVPCLLLFRWTWRRMGTWLRRRERAA
ncbi:MAG TPA: DUF4349 domain-containing protein [Povalibacter sp.]